MKTKVSLTSLLVYALCATSASASGDHVYFDVALNELEVDGGTLPPSPQRCYTKPRGNFMRPYAAGGGGVEFHVFLDEGWRSQRAIMRTMDAARLTACSSTEGPVTGRVYLPRADWCGMEYRDFVMREPAADQEAAKARFLQAKRDHFKLLLGLGCPGSAWFRHRIGGEVPAMTWGRPAGDSAFQRALDILTGGRALRQNLRLDWPLQVNVSGENTIPVEWLAGVTTADIDWCGKLEDPAPAKDPLAAYIPADQHALFFPSFQALADLVGEIQSHGATFLRLLDARSEVMPTWERYQRQLGLSLEADAPGLDAGLIQTVACTGSDPYWSSGTDVAILFQTAEPKALLALVIARQDATMLETPEGESVETALQGGACRGVVTPDRRVSSYAVALDGAVAVSNSSAQLNRLCGAAKRIIPSLDALDEYAFFRGRYPLSEPGETALLVLSEATIKRWCGPEWRIGDSRRVRAAARLADIQVQHLDQIAAGQVSSVSLAIEDGAPLGELLLTPDGPRSSVFGTLGFLTPILELDMHAVSREEAASYNVFRQYCKHGPGNRLAPLALRLSAKEKRVSADLTVQTPSLGPWSCWLRYFTGDITLGPAAGDPHPEALIHAVVAVDKDGWILRNFFPGFGLPPVEWLGTWVALYADADPFWEELAQAGATRGETGVKEFLRRHFARMPVAVLVEVADAAGVNLFLNELQQLFSDLRWEHGELAGRACLQVCLMASFRERYLAEAAEEPVLYTAVTRDAVIISLRKDILERALARRASSAHATEPPSVQPEHSLRVQAAPGALEAIEAVTTSCLSELLEQQAWRNIPILNEWRRCYPNEDPVRFHERFWHRKLVCPGGGQYAWNEEYQSMESTVYGHPGQPRTARPVPAAWRDFIAGDFSLTFEEGALRAHTVLERKRGE